MLAMFFAAVALLLAGMGLYGVLRYTLLRRQREIGIRLAIGAPPGDIARRVSADVLSMVVVGGIVGVVLGTTVVRYIETLLYQVKASDIMMLVLPSITMVAAACLSSVPVVIRALRIDPATLLRTD